MIKLTRPSEPTTLAINKAKWTKALSDAVSQYGGYDKIPEKEKEAILVHYRHQDIKDPLFASSYFKCAFCECMPGEGGNIEVEHFAPKSIHPKSTFDWQNLLPSCRKCNSSKHDHDTVVEPILNPYVTDPTDVFDYDDIAMVAVEGPLKGVATRTITVCGLESVRLWTPRSQILVSLRVFSKAISGALVDWS